MFCFVLLGLIFRFNKIVIFEALYSFLWLVLWRNATYLLTTKQDILFVMVYIKQILTFLESYYQTILHIFFRVHITQYTFRELLHIFSEFISNNIDTSRATTKQYYKIILFYKFLSNESDIFRELLPDITDFFQGRCIRQYFFLSQMWTYFKSWLNGISAKSTFRKVFGFEKLKTM